MIRRHNLKQVLLAILAAGGGLICYFLAYLFFRHIPALASSQFGFPMTPTVAAAVAAAGVLAVSLSGYRVWKAGGGLQGYHESAFYHDMEINSGGSAMVDLYAHRVTGTAHILSQVFLSGPLGLLRCGTLLAGRIPNSPGLENRLSQTLEILRTANKWQSITEYPNHHEEILYLAQMGLIDFSAAKGVPRIKASPAT